MTKARVKYLLVAGMTGSLLLLQPFPFREAAAGWRTVHATSCKVISGAVTYNSVGQIANVSTTTVAVLHCPMDADTYVQTGATGTTLTVSGYSNAAGGIQAKACVTWFAGGGGTCTATPSQSTQGVNQMSPSTTVWSGSAGSDYAYVWVQLGFTVSQSSNVIWGLGLTNP